MSGTSRLLDARVATKGRTAKMLSAIDKLLRFMDNVPTDEQLDILLQHDGFTGRDAAIHARNVAIDVRHELNMPEAETNSIEYKVSAAINLKRLSGFVAYGSNPSRSQSSPFDLSDRFGKWHPFDALLAERRALLAGDRDAIAAVGKKDAAWWGERRRG